jgi:hypothetical protein
VSVTDRSEPTVSRAAFRSDILIGGCLAVLLSAHSIFILCYSLVGSSGNTVFTGALLATVLVAILTLSFRSDIVIGAADYLFAAFVLCVVVSFAINGRTADTKEWAIFAMSLAAYPACRFIHFSQLSDARPAFTWITGIVVSLGAIITAQALFAQWNDMHGKPIVSGFDVAGTLFLGSLGFFLISLATAPTTKRKTAIISASFLLLAIFAASQIRATFLAIVSALCLAAILSGTRQRKYIAIIVLVAITGICAGLIARSEKTATFLSYATGEIPEKPATIDNRPHNYERPISTIKPPSCSLDVDLNNSIAERKALTRDALYLIPRAGVFGTGLDSFLSLSCMPFFIHNSALQAFVEFGWFGGSSLFLLVLLSLALLFSTARKSNDVRFVFCSLAYVVALSIAHGRTSRDIMLFALLGLAAGISETCRAKLDH